MVNRDEVIELVPHYVVMILLVVVVIGIIRATVDDLGPLVEFAIILVVVFSYRPIIARLDAVPTPALWERERRTQSGMDGEDEEIE